MKLKIKNSFIKAFKGGRDLSPFWLLAACGGGSGEIGGKNSTSLDSIGEASGLPPSYTSPPSEYSQPNVKDPYSFTLAAPGANAYWVNSLKSFATDRIPTLDVSSKKYIYTYQFPKVVPATYVGTDYELGWKPVNELVQAAYLGIFDHLESMFQISFVPGSDANKIHDIVISHADLDFNIVGYGFFPDAYDPLGSDILIDNAFSNPRRTGSTTNFDFEALVHELGHAIGLKHPFEKYSVNDVVLNSKEDNTFWTVMSYKSEDQSFDGKFRAFDLMALAEIYGVNPDYRAGNDTYYFSKTAPNFVIDGGGLDTISAASETTPVFIDLREGSHSFLGVKSSYISSPGQLIISSNSIIENAYGGQAADYLVGNSHTNYLVGGSGDDAIFAAGGADIIDGGQGFDLIDLSETTQAIDEVVLNPSNTAFDRVYSFVQGDLGDQINLVGRSILELTPVVSSANVPIAQMDNVVLRLAGDLDTNVKLEEAFKSSGAFSNLEVLPDGEILVVTANSQQTGEDQNVFYVSHFDDDLDAILLARFFGNYLDLDSWSTSNFL